MTSPLIGIAGVTRAWDGNERAGVNAAYVRSVIRAGGTPLILSPLTPASDAAALTEVLDGLVLTGGEDVDPSYFGEPPHPKLGSVDRARDAFELELFHAALQRQVPVLAICRGIQLVNVALGGTLWQDLPAQRPGAVAHDQPDRRNARTHRIVVEPGTLLARALGSREFEANSFHHQAVRDVAPGLVVSARADDGLVEGVEFPAGAPWLLAVQWHPEEFHADARAPERGLFAALVGQATVSADTPMETARARSSR